jgi:bacterioferritin
MRTDPQIIELLNDVLTAELSAVNQYFVHAKMCGDWGYTKLHDHTRAESIDEMRHAEAVVERILYLDGVPNLQRLLPLRVGESVREQFTNDLELEYAAVERLNAGIARAVERSDGGTRTLLEQILVSEEDHIDWLETQLAAMDDLGEPIYLSMQLG